MDTLFLPTLEEFESFSTEEFEKEVQEKGEVFLQEELKSMTGVIIAIRMLHYVYGGMRVGYWEHVYSEATPHYSPEGYSYLHELSFTYMTIREISKSYRVDKGIPYFGFLYSFTPKRIKTKTYEAGEYFGNVRDFNVYNSKEDGGHDMERTDLFLPHGDTVQQNLQEVYIREILDFIVDDAPFTEYQRKVFSEVVANPELDVAEVARNNGEAPKRYNNVLGAQIRPLVQNTYKLEDFGYYK